MQHKTLLAVAVTALLSTSAYAQTDNQQNKEATTSLPATGHQQSITQEIDSSTESMAPATADMAVFETYELRASDLLGAEVENAQDEDIGEIDDLIIGSDQKLHAVLSVGGFLGIGDRRVLVPYDQLQIEREAGDDEIDVVYNATKAELEGKQAFTYREGDLSWRERMQQRMGEWTDKAKEAVENVTQDDQTQQNN